MCRIPWAKRTLFCQSLLIGKGQVACVACVSLFRWNTLWWYWRWSEAQLQSGDFSSKAMPQNWQWKSKRSEKLFGFSPNPYFPNLIFQTIFTTEILMPVISGISADGKTRLHFFVLFTPLIKKKKNNRQLPFGCAFHSAGQSYQAAGWEPTSELVSCGCYGRIIDIK